jgi:hypothetical protein
VKLNDTTKDFYPGEKYQGLLPLSNSPNQIITKLSNDSLNIYYAAAYVCLIQKRWQKAGYPLDQQPGIIGTLYSTGLFYPDGKERKPNEHPHANEFGKQVANRMLSSK